jgi:predicted house-cleaning noncanonical NTP pyrophosphatase (MazG superfamily)
MRVVYNKLIRDRIPEIIRAAGYNPVIRTLDESRYTEALLVKLLEEAHEAQVAPAQELSEELADVLEVLMSIASAVGITWEQILNVAAAKRNERGGFQHRLLLEYVDEPD